MAPARLIHYPIKRDNADVLVTLQIFDDGPEIVCGLRFIEGTINLPPRALRRAVTEELQIIEQAARESGCTEMRHAGEDRAWALPGYEPIPNSTLRNGRRKRL